MFLLYVGHNRMVSDLAAACRFRKNRLPQCRAGGAEQQTRSGYHRESNSYASLPARPKRGSILLC